MTTSMLLDKILAWQASHPGPHTAAEIAAGLGHHSPKRIFTLLEAAEDEGRETRRSRKSAAVQWEVTR